MQLFLIGHVPFVQGEAAIITNNKAVGTIHRSITILAPAAGTDPTVVAITVVVVVVMLTDIETGVVEAVVVVEGGTTIPASTKAVVKVVANE